MQSQTPISAPPITPPERPCISNTLTPSTITPPSKATQPDSSVEEFITYTIQKHNLIDQLDSQLALDTTRIVAMLKVIDVQVE